MSLSTRNASSCGEPASAATPRRHRGLTLLELIVIIVVLTVMATVAIPGMQQLNARSEIAAEVMRIRTALALARSAAVTRRATVSVCPRPTPESSACDFDDWAYPLVVVEGQAPGGNLAATQLLKVLAGSEGPSVTFNRSYPVRYQATGWSRGHNGTFTICGRNDESAAVVISNMGRVRSEGKNVEC